jgi:putative DNA primase/helicase
MSGDVDDLAALLRESVQGARPADEDELVVAAPGNPLAVARIFMAERYADTRAPLLLYHRGLYYTWTGTHWLEVESRAVRAEIYRWLEPAWYWKETKSGRELVRFEPTKVKVANVLEALEAIVHMSERMDAPAWVNSDAPWPADDTVALENGLLRRSTRELHPHTPAFFNAHVLPFAYSPRARKPRRWTTFLRELWGDDQESIDALCEIMGYVLAGGTAQQKMFLLVGPRRSGKGTILRVLTALLGPENVCAPTLSSLSTNFGLQPLVGKALAAISDARLGSRSDSFIAVERLLSISGEDSITIDRKYRDAWTGRLPTRFLLLTNEIPAFTDASGALASRFVLLTLTTSFYGREDTTLTDRLLEEAPAIFNWCLEGLDRLTARGYFQQPSAALAALRHLEDLASPVSAFVRDRCRVGAGLAVDKDELWAAWKDWLANEGGKPGTKNVFIRDLRAAVPGATPKRLGSRDERRHVIAGLELAATDTGTDVDPQSSGTLTIPDTEGRVRGRQGSETLSVNHRGALSGDEIERLADLGRELKNQPSSPTEGGSP